MAVALINGQAYDFTQVSVKINGVEINSTSAISYTEEQSKENNFGTGNRPVSRGRGAIDASGSITISMNDVEALRDSVEEFDGSLLAIAPFDIQVSFLNSQRIINHILKNCEFMDDGVETSQDDKDIVRSFNLIISNVKYR